MECLLSIGQSETSKILADYIIKNFVIKKIEPFYFSDVYTRCPFYNNYDPKVLYLAQKLILSGKSDDTTDIYVRIYDENKKIIIYAQPKVSYFDNVKHRLSNNIMLTDILFSTCFVDNYPRLTLVGYKIYL